jgi:protein-tyrosine phosphatase
MPDDRTPRPGGDPHYCVLVVCSGNICRSPMAEHVLRAAFDEAGLGDRVTVSSAGTGDWHVGAGASGGTVRVLGAAGYPFDHAARQVTRQMLDDTDLVLAADRGHVEDLLALGARPDAVALLRSFDPAATGQDVPDPYGLPDSAYQRVFEIITAATPGVVEEVRRRLADRGRQTAPAEPVPTR